MPAELPIKWHKQDKYSSYHLPEFILLFATFFPFSRVAPISLSAIASFASLQFLQVRYKI